VSKVTCATVNKELKRLGYDAKLYQGKGYLYFVGELLKDNTMVCVDKAAHLSVDQWMQEYRDLTVG
jgi:hypothetical protein